MFIFSFASDSKAQSYYLTIENTGDYDVNVSVAIHATTCQYYEDSTDVWSNTGCVPTINSTTSQSLCTCSHMTMFGATVLVSPAQIKFRDLPVSKGVVIAITMISAVWRLTDFSPASLISFCLQKN